MNQSYDVVIIGGGAAGLMCAIECGKRGRNTLLIEHCNRIGKKILISGGGRCNFTNIGAAPENYISKNEHFCKSAFARFSPADFIALVKKYDIAFHEKKLGQLFCNESARQIVSMLQSECDSANVNIQLNCSVTEIAKDDSFLVKTDALHLKTDSVVIASGGLSIPKMGATGFGHRIAKQFGHKLVETKPALVPLTFSKEFLDNFSGLSGQSMDAEVTSSNVSFRENVLITHRGVSGPAILQISSYWNHGDSISINLLPDKDLTALLDDPQNANREVKGLLYDHLPKRFVQRVFDVWLENKQVGKLAEREKLHLSKFFHNWILEPNGTEGYRTAEVTLGGVDVNGISSKTFESKTTPGLYFIGEVLDVTGWLGGYNFQWAWASGYCAGQYA